MIREIVQVGDPVLRRGARALTRDEILSREVQELIADMQATMRAAPGVGLAAPQVGVGLRIAVIEDPAEALAKVPPERLAAQKRKPVPFHVLINPELEVVDATPELFFEGCLSMRDHARTPPAPFLAVVPRALRVRVRALDARAQAVTVDGEGWYARILQHEIDHLGGTLFVDRMDSRTLTTQENHFRFSAGAPR